LSSSTCGRSLLAKTAEQLAALRFISVTKDGADG
jgi:hypothetical protein